VQPIATYDWTYERAFIDSGGWRDKPLRWSGGPVPGVSILVAPGASLRSLRLGRRAFTWNANRNFSTNFPAN
jgi:hypothetical protein